MSVGSQRLPDDHPDDGSGFGAERDPDADLLPPQRDDVGDDAVEAAGREQEREDSEQPRAARVIIFNSLSFSALMSASVETCAIGTLASTSRTAAWSAATLNRPRPVQSEVERASRLIGQRRRVVEDRRLLGRRASTCRQRRRRP